MFDLPLWAWIVIAIVNVPTALGLGRWVFGTWDGFIESLRLTIQPDLLSIVRGELMDDWRESLRLSIFVVLLAGTVLLQLWLCSRVLG